MWETFNTNCWIGNI